MTAEKIINAILFKSTPPYVKPSKQPAAGACSQFKTPIKIIKIPMHTEEFK